MEDTLKTVKIIENTQEERLDKKNTIEKDVLSQFQFDNLEKVLAIYSNAFVRNYGNSNLSTISLRGSSAAQTQVVWHGISINNALHGMSDFSLFPTSFFSSVSIYNNTLAANTIGGYISLDQKPQLYNKDWSVSAAYHWESLLNHSSFLNFEKSNRKTIFTTQVSLKYAHNKYAFDNTFLNKRDTITHGLYKSFQNISSIHRKINNNDQIAVHVWYSHTNREIPKATFEGKSEKEECIKTLRTVVENNLRIGKYKSHTQLGFIYDDYTFTDSILQIHSNSSVNTYSLSENLTYTLGHEHTATLSATSSIQHMNTEPFQNIARQLISFQYKVSPRYNKWYIATMFQKEFTNRFSLPLIASLSMKYKVWKKHFLQASVSKNYRIPTLNELFYIPGGNEQLKPEISKNAEGGISSNLFYKKHLLTMDHTLYTRHVQDWILWYGGAIFTPHNIQEVWSRGYEAQLNYKFFIKKKPSEIIQEIIIAKSEKILSEKTIHAQVFYSYNLATSIKSNIQNDQSIGKQIPYVPRYQLKTSIAYQTDFFKADYIYTYTGYRFITTDESQYLLPYSQHHIYVSYLYQMKQYKFRFSMSLQNLFNRTYESMIGRVMPGRSIAFGIQCSYH
ncbi:MAG: TonB-dependent receptor [Chitinophagaceae bacterium]